MISEVVNALLITYVATEYLLEDINVKNSGFQRLRQIIQTKLFVVLVIVVIILNIIDRVTGAADVINNLLRGFLHLPKVLFAALLYVVALYFDCKRVATSSRGTRTLTVSTFLPLVGKAFCRVLPAYPFLAVIISFGFMIIINIFETLHIPLDILNWPIYYGTLYGPFSFVYWKVKERVVEDTFHTLPSIKTPW